MEKIAIITDSTSDLTQDIIDKYDIKVMPLQIIYQSKIYRDKVDITPEQIYSGMEREVPKTSLPLTADMVKTFEQLKQEGYTHILGAFISSGLSGTYNMVRNMANDYKDDFVIELIDSKSISWGSGFGIVEAAKAREAGASFEDVVAAAKKAIKNTRSIFVLPTLYYLKKGGRMGRVEGTVGDLLNIKPIVGVDEAGDGQYFTIKKVRGRKKSLTELFNVIHNLVKDKEAFEVIVLSGNAPEESTEIAEKFKAMPNCKYVLETSVSPVIGVHTGPGLLALSVKCDSGMDNIKEDK